MNAINVKSSSTADLLAFLNAHSGKEPVKRFSTRAAGERRVAALLEELGTKATKAAPSKKAAAADKPRRRAADKGAADRSASIAASWKDPKVAAARATRHAVVVVDDKGNKETYRSVRQAFEALDLPLGRHIKFRGALKAAGKQELAGFKFRLA
jgi:hypothetical protein